MYGVGWWCFRCTGSGVRGAAPEAREVGSALGMPLECTAITMVILAWGWSILVIGLERGVIVMSLDKNAIPMVRLAWGWSILVMCLDRGVIVMSLDQNAIPMVRLAWG